MTFALLYFYIWGRRTKRLDYLYFAIAAVAASLFACVELLLASAESLAAYGAILRWIHIPGFLIVVSLTLFIRLHLGTGRWWLAGVVIALRVLMVVLIYGLGLNIHYSELTNLHTIDLWFGGSITSVELIYNPLAHIDDASCILLLVFVVDAAASAWRRRDRARTLVIPLAIVLFVAVIETHLALVYLGLFNSPFVVSIGYMLVIIATSRELGFDILDAAELAERLEISEAELAEGQQRMALAAEAAQLGMWVWDIPKDRFWSTDRGLAIFGLAPGTEPSLSQVLQTVHHEDRKVMLEAVDTALEQGCDVRVEYRVTPASGEIRWVASRGQIEFGQNGRPEKLRGVSIDITERKAVELEVSRSQAELAHLSRVMMLGELSGSMAHELNQPLAAILSNAEAAESLLEGDSPDLSELREILADIVEQDVRAGEVIRRLRTLLIKGEIQARPLDISDLMQDLLSLVRNDLANRGVGITMHLANDLPPVVADRVQLQQVLLNLVVNACEAMVDAPSSERVLTLRSTLDDQGQVRVSVVDRGRGISPDKRDEIFQPFVTTKADGLGLGLAISRTIVEAHGGRIWADSEDGQGTCMCLTLPVVRSGDL